MRRRLLLLGSLVVLVVSWQLGVLGQDPQDRPTAASAGESDVSPPLPLPAHSYTLRQGEALFRHYCATCHGESGAGDGFNAYALDPKPRDLSDPTFYAQRTDEELTAIVRTGGGAVGLSNAMPPWGRTLSDRQIDQVVSYVRSLAAGAEGATGDE